MGIPVSGPREYVVDVNPESRKLSPLIARQNRSRGSGETHNRIRHASQVREAPSRLEVKAPFMAGLAHGLLSCLADGGNRLLIQYSGEWKYKKLRAIPIAPSTGSVGWHAAIHACSYTGNEDDYWQRVATGAG